MFIKIETPIAGVVVSSLIHGKENSRLQRREGYFKLRRDQ